MTAIYLMWNNNGFALAADSNQTAAANNQTWVDSVDKIMSIPGHQIAFGAAGGADLEGVDVNEIVRVWAKSLPKEHLPNFDDYIISFLKFYASEFEPNANVFESSNIDFLKTETETFKGWLKENNGDIDLTRDQWIKDLRHNAWNLNIFAPNWDEFVNTSDFESTLNDVTIEKLERVEKIRNSVLSNLKHIDFEISSRPEFQRHLGEIINEKFPELLEMNLSDEQMIKVVEIITCNLANRFTIPGEIKFVFAGYGENDWIPNAVRMKIKHKVFGVPFIAIETIGTPLNMWFMSIAVDSGVNSLIRGLDQGSKEELLENLRPHIKKNHEEKLENLLNLKSQERFDNAMSKIDALTLSRLEYVARLFVQIEALQSYLNEPVPGVGGDTRIISMTKTLRNEKLVNEMP